MINILRHGANLPSMPIRQRQEITDVEAAYRVLSHMSSPTPTPNSKTVLKNAISAYHENEKHWKMENYGVSSLR